MTRWNAAGLIGLVVVLGIGGCGGGGFRPPGGGGGGALMVISPSASGMSVNSPSIGIEVAANGIMSVSATVNGGTTAGVLNGSSFFILGVPLIPGMNAISLDALDTSGAPVMATLDVVSTVDPDGFTPSIEVEFTATPRVLDTAPLDASLQIDAQVEDVATEVLVDRDGDGVFDVTMPFSTAVQVNYPAIGTFKPSVTVRTAGNLLFTSDFDHAPIVTVMAPPVPDPALEIPNAGMGITDLVLDEGGTTLFVLSSGEGVVRTFSVLDGTLLQTITIAGAAGALGIAVDGDDNLYVADTLNDRVLRLLAATGYSPDTMVSPTGAFGSSGTAAGEFMAPGDVAVTEVDGAAKIFVADSGNDRIQRFNIVGAIEADLSVAQGAPTLDASAGLMALRDGGILVSDTGNDLLRLLDSDGNAVDDIGMPGASPGEFSGPAHLSIGPAGAGIVVADPGNSRVQILGIDGSVDRVINLPGMLPCAAVIADTPYERRLFVASAAGNAVHVLPLPDDPPGFAPVDVTQSFVATLVASNFDGATMLVHPSVRDAFGQALQAQGAMTAVMQTAAAITSLTTLHIGPMTALVAGEVMTMTGPEDTDFALQRDARTGQWLIENF